MIARGGRVRARLGSRVWLPALLERRGDRPLRVAPMAHGGRALGLIVVERAPGYEPFGARDERLLAELARQVGLALRNVRLDSQLQASLDEIRRQTEQLRASRARVVSAGGRRAAADRARPPRRRTAAAGRAQREPAARARAGGLRPGAGDGLLEELGGDVEAALEELRELATGSTRRCWLERGLAEALSVVAARAPLAARGSRPREDRALPASGRGDGVLLLPRGAAERRQARRRRRRSATMRVREDEGGLLFEVTDNGVGFDPAARRRAPALTNMTDRLGAIGGQPADRFVAGPRRANRRRDPAWSAERWWAWSWSTTGLRFGGRRGR